MIAKCNLQGLQSLLLKSKMCLQLDKRVILCPRLSPVVHFGEIQDDIAIEVLTLLVYLCHLALFQKLPLYALFIHYFNSSCCHLTVASVFYRVLNHV